MRTSAPFRATSALAHLSHSAARSMSFTAVLEDGSADADGMVLFLEVAQKSRHRL